MASTNTNQEYRKRFNRAVSGLGNNFRYQNKTKRDKSLEMEIAWTIHEIEKYGFNFYPEHYIEDKMQELEKLSKTFKNRFQNKGNK